MRNYNNVRGILRAKQGSQIPKFNGGGPFNIDLSFTQTKPITDMFQYQKIYNTSYQDLPDSWTNYQSGNNPNPYMNNSGQATPKPDASTGTGTGDNNENTSGKPINSGVAKLAGFGFDMLGQTFNNVYNNKGTDTLFAAGDTIAEGLSTINPVLGMYGKGAMTLLKGINSLGGKKTQKFGLNRATLEQVGSSYGGSSNLIADAASKAGKKYGLFSSGSRRRANRQIDQARIQQNIMTDIADTAADQRAMVNDLNYINNQFTLNGGYDQRYMRAAKSGMKIQDKIDFIKQRKAIHNSINLETKQVEWEPVIEEFKEGGNLPELQEPVIEDIWEPIITDIVEEFKEGGKTKEELETPEIEETNQKNLIPEGALHKNKHHMEHTEGLTQKGIPVIDNDGEQQAEIELDEIIFTLEVTKKLEELYKEGTDEAAIEAGKLLVKEILFNTDDRTGLISKCEKGGKL